MIAGKEFEIAREFEVDASPAEVWDAFTTGTGCWLWPLVEYEPREGGAAPFGGIVTHWEPPHRLTDRADDPTGLPPGQKLNLLDRTIEPRDGGRRSWVRYVHSGIFTGAWDSQYEEAAKHTDFYLHTLCQYLTYFTGLPVTFTALDGPAPSTAPGAFARLGRRLGLPTTRRKGPGCAWTPRAETSTRWSTSAAGTSSACARTPRSTASSAATTSVPP